MKKTILVATDFSPAATNAAYYAADLARSLRADILLFHAFQVPVNSDEFPLVLNEGEIKKAIATGLSRLEAELINRTERKMGIETFITAGLFLNELKSTCEDVKPYLVILGCQGTTSGTYTLYGSHAAKALQYLEWPVISIPSGVLYTGIKKIGLACDFNQTIDILPFEEIQMLVRDLHAELHIINMSDSKEFDAETVFESDLIMEMLANIKPECHFIATKKTDDGILEFIRENRIDLLIIIPKRHTLINKLIHRSHTKHLVLHSHVPVMALHD